MLKKLAILMVTWALGSASLAEGPVEIPGSNINMVVGANVIWAQMEKFQSWPDIISPLDPPQYLCEGAQSWYEEGGVVEVYQDQPTCATAFVTWLANNFSPNYWNHLTITTPNDDLLRGTPPATPTLQDVLAYVNNNWYWPGVTVLPVGLAPYAYTTNGSETYCAGTACTVSTSDTLGPTCSYQPTSLTTIVCPISTPGVMGSNGAYTCRNQPCTPQETEGSWSCTTQGSPPLTCPLYTFSQQGYQPPIQNAQPGNYTCEGEPCTMSNGPTANYGYPVMGRAANIIAGCLNAHNVVCGWCPAPSLQPVADCGACVAGYGTTCEELAADGKCGYQTPQDCCLAMCGNGCSATCSNLANY